MDAAPAPRRLVWADPPAARSGPTGEPWFLDELKRNPGKWALVAKAKSNSASASLKKRWGLEAVGRKNPTGGFDIYARWPA